MFTPIPNPPGSLISTPLGTMRPGARLSLTSQAPSPHDAGGRLTDPQGLIVSRKTSLVNSVDPVGVMLADATPAVVPTRPTATATATAPATAKRRLLDIFFMANVLC
jgi:hypothetical protein